MSIEKNLNLIKSRIPDNICLVAVSKTKPEELILRAYKKGQRIFGENKVQELIRKSGNLPKDIQWHMIGHLQSNKVKYIAPFISLIHGVDSLKLAKEINKQAIKNNRTIDVLLQVHIARETSKFGFSPEKIIELIKNKTLANYESLSVKGLMGMATYTVNNETIKKEFAALKTLFDKVKTHFGPQFNTLSMGMSGDYQLAIEEGSTMIRVGSRIFGERDYV